MYYCENVKNNTIKIPFILSLRYIKCCKLINYEFILLMAKQLSYNSNIKWFEKLKWNETTTKK